MYKVDFQTGVPARIPQWTYIHESNIKVVFETNGQIQPPPLWQPGLVRIVHNCPKWLCLACWGCDKPVLLNWGADHSHLWWHDIILSHLASRSPYIVVLYNDNDKVLLHYMVLVCNHFSQWFSPQWQTYSHLWLWASIWDGGHTKWSLSWTAVGRVSFWDLIYTNILSGQH